MTVLSLDRIVAEALAEVGIDMTGFDRPRVRPRTTTWVAGESGFGIRHYASGRGVYVVQTRMGGRLRTVTIGPVTVLTLPQARTVARRVIAHARVGNDPASERIRIRSAPRFDAFLDEYWRRWSPRWKPSTRETHDGYRALYLDDAFPNATIDALNEADVTRWFADLNDRTGPGAANRVMTILNNMLNKAEEWGYRLANTNPCRSVRRNRRRRCERFLNSAEMVRLGGVLAAEREGGVRTAPVRAVAITLLLLTGCRMGEILGLHWQDVHGHRLKLRDSKTGPRTVWLADEARALIATLPRYKGVPWLFWNPGHRKPIRDLTVYWHDVRDRAGLPGVRIHDLRHSFASHAAMNHETLPMIGRLLGHRSVQSTARYAHLDDAHISDAAEQIGMIIEQMADGGVVRWPLK